MCIRDSYRGEWVAFWGNMLVLVRVLRRLDGARQRLDLPASVNIQAHFASNQVPLESQQRAFFQRDWLGVTPSPVT